MRSAVLACGLAFAASFLAVHTPAQEKVQVKPVKYPELGELVRRHLGKVIVVDIWATW